MYSFKLNVRLIHFFDMLATNPMTTNQDGSMQQNIMF